MIGADGLGHVVGHVGRPAARDDQPRRIVAAVRRERRRLRRGEHHLERRQRDGTDHGLPADGHGDVDGPVGARHLAELTRAVERVDDPEPAVPRHVLEPLLGAHVVVGIQPVQLAHQEVVGQSVPGGTDVGRSPGSPLSSTRAFPANEASKAASRCSSTRSPGMAPF